MQTGHGSAGSSLGSSSWTSGARSASHASILHPFVVDESRGADVFDDVLTVGQLRAALKVNAQNEAVKKRVVRAEMARHVAVCRQEHGGTSSTTRSPGRFRASTCSWSAKAMRAWARA